MRKPDNISVEQFAIMSIALSDIYYRTYTMSLFRDGQYIVERVRDPQVIIDNLGAKSDLDTIYVHRASTYLGYVQLQYDQPERIIHDDSGRLVARALEFQAELQFMVR